MPMLTYTDRVVLPTIAAPSLIDIAVALSRMPRFGGHTRRWWSVLDHTLFCDELVKSEPDFVTRESRLALLFHDAHEAITGDVPTGAKTTGLRLLQADIDVAIMDAFYPGGLMGFNKYRETVKYFDRLALVAEGHVVGPPVSPERLVEVDPVFDLGLKGALEACWALQALLEGVSLDPLGQPPLVENQESHPAVVEYLTRITTLL
jgi:hypothetical protein